MATYVFTDIHGHAKPLRRILERIAPQDEDQFICLGDMIDRGPDPLGVIETVKTLPHVVVLQGNHEQMLGRFLANEDDTEALITWIYNGGETTRDQLKSYSQQQRFDLLEWLQSLPLHYECIKGGRPYILVHAGIRAGISPVPPAWNLETLHSFVELQNTEDLLWIREDFWSRPTGLVDSGGNGPIVICGHTPTPYLASVGASNINRSAQNEEGLAQYIRAGATPATGNVHDKWGIDTGTVGGAGYGQVSVIRLDDEAEFTEPLQVGD